MAVNGAGLAVALAGAVLTYSGIKGKKISTTVRDLIAGNDPTKNTTTDLPIITPDMVSPNAGSPGPTAPGAPNDNPPKPGQHLSARQIYQTARSAGFSPASAVTATAIALAESQGHPSSLNNNPGTGDLSYGLWQVNMIGNLGPARRSQFGLSDNSQLFDPATNARAAYSISNGGRDFSPWTTFTAATGYAYRQYLGQAMAAANG